MGQELIHIGPTAGNGWYRFIAKRRGETIAIGAGKTVEVARKDLKSKLTKMIAYHQKVICKYEQALHGSPCLIEQERQEKKALEDALRDLQGEK